MWFNTSEFLSDDQKQFPLVYESVQRKVRNGTGMKDNSDFRYVM